MTKSTYLSSLFFVFLTSCVSTPISWKPVNFSDSKSFSNLKATFQFSGLEMTDPGKLKDLIHQDLFNKKPIIQWYSDGRREFFQEAEEVANLRAETQNDLAQFPLELYEETRMTAVSCPPGYFLVSRSWSGYHGGAHPNHQEDYFLYTTQPAQRVHLDQILTKAKEPNLQNLLAAELSQALQGDRPLFQILLVDQIPRPEDFYPASEGIHFQWDPYEITPYSFGSLDVVLSWETLEDLLTPEGLKMREDFRAR